MSFHRSSIEEFNASFDLIQYAYNHFGGELSSNYVKINCPFHPENTPSCVVYSNSYYCFGAGCGVHGDSIDFVQKTTGLSIEEILSTNEFITDNNNSVQSRRKIKQKENYPSLSKIKQYNANLLENPQKLDYLYKRHFDDRSIRRAKLGYATRLAGFTKFNKPRFVIPVFDKHGRILTARYRIDPQYDTNEEPKYLAHPQAPVALYNSHLLDKYKDIVIVGSELDAAFLYYRFGIYAVAPPGENNFKSNWAYGFRNHNVLIWLDYDYAGIHAAIKTYNMINTFAQVQIYTWDSSFRNKDDICDFVTERSIIGVIEELNRYNVKAYN